MSIAIILAHGEQWATTTFTPATLEFSLASESGHYEAFFHALQVVAAGNFSEHPTAPGSVIDNHFLTPLARDEREWFESSLNSFVVGRWDPTLYYVGEGVLQGVSVYCDRPEVCDPEPYGNPERLHDPQCAGLFNVLHQHGVRRAFSINCRGSWWRSWLAARLPESIGRHVRPAVNDTEPDEQFMSVLTEMQSLIVNNRMYQAWQRYQSYSEPVKALLSARSSKVREMVAQAHSADGASWYTDALQKWPRLNTSNSARIELSHTGPGIDPTTGRPETPELPGSIARSEMDSFQNLFLRWARDSGELPTFVYAVLQLFGGENFISIVNAPTTPVRSEGTGRVKVFKEQEELEGFPLRIADFSLDVRRLWVHPHRQALLDSLGLGAYQDLPEQLDSRFKQLVKIRESINLKRTPKYQGPEKSVEYYVRRIENTKRWLLTLQRDVRTAMDAGPNSPLSQFRAALVREAGSDRRRTRRSP